MGIVAGLLRFVPYVGSVVASLGPLALAAAIDPGWHLVLEVGLLFVVVEPLVGYAIEPLLYGHSTGLTPISVVVAALFWTWIWGPLGLVLSMPLTLVLVVLGRHVPAFEVFDILLGDRPALTPAETFYQRALAGHPEEAIEHAEDLLQTLTLTSYYDEVVLGGFRLAAADVDRGAVERDALRAVCDTTMEVLDALAGHEDAVPRDAGLAPTDAPIVEPRRGDWGKDLVGRTVVCLAGRGPLDPAVAAMMGQLLRRAGCTVQMQSRETMRRESGAGLPQEHADAVCILGLFDERSFRRIRPLVQQSVSATVLIGVRRGEGPASAADSPQELLPSLSAMSEALQPVIVCK